MYFQGYLLTCHLFIYLFIYQYVIDGKKDSFYGHNIHSFI